MTRYILKAVIACVTWLALTPHGWTLDRRERADLEDLVPSERMIQLCDMEVLDEHLGDKVIAYTFAPTKISGDKLTAPGASVRKRGRWYRLRYTCTTDRDHMHILAFSYHLGDLVPRKDWGSHYLF